MKRIKPWSALLLAAALIVSLLTGCSQEQAAGISLSVCVGSEPVTLDPIYAEETADQTILVHLYENLMRVALDATGQNTVTYGIAKSVSQEANYDGTVTYTFKLRSAHWSDGVSVKADDFVYAWQRLADPASQSPYAELLSVVVGYDESPGLRRYEPAAGYRQERHHVGGRAQRQLRLVLVPGMHVSGHHAPASGRDPVPQGRRHGSPGFRRG